MTVSIFSNLAAVLQFIIFEVFLFTSCDSTVRPCITPSECYREETDDPQWINRSWHQLFTSLKIYIRLSHKWPRLTCDFRKLLHYLFFRFTFGDWPNKQSIIRNRYTHSNVFARANFMIVKLWKTRWETESCSFHMVELDHFTAGIIHTYMVCSALFSRNF